MSRICMIAVALLCIGAKASWTQAVQPEGGGTWFEWDPVGLVADGDSVYGVHLWALDATSGPVIRGDRNFSERFSPDAVIDWLASLDQLLSAPVKGVDKVDSDLRTPLLDDGLGGGVQASRARKKHGWEASPIVTFVGDSGKGGFRIKLSQAEAADFVAGLRWFAERVPHLAPAPLPPGVVCVARGDPLDTPPRPLGHGNQPLPAFLRDRTRRGKALVSFVLDTTGHPEMETMRTVFATDSTMLRLAHEWIGAETFQPGMKHGHAVRVLVDQAVVYRSGR